jgi:hypothetical protein
MGEVVSETISPQEKSPFIPTHPSGGAVIIIAAQSDNLESWTIEKEMNGGAVAIRLKVVPRIGSAHNNST